MENTEKFDKLFRLSKQKLFSVAYLVTKNKEQAEDVLQNSYYKAWKKFDTYDDSKKFINWMTTIVRNTAIDSNRTKHRKENVINLSALDNGTSKQVYQIEDTSANMQKIMNKNDFIREFYELVEAMPEDLRNVITDLIQGESYMDISKKYNINIQAVRAKIHRAKKLLKKTAKNSELSSFYGV